MRYKYFFFERQNSNIIDWLEKNKIRYYLDGGGVVPVFVNFTLWSSDNNVNDYLAQLEDMHVKSPVITAEFTSSELLKAKFLMLCPKKQCIDIINHHDAYRYSCTWMNPYGFKKARHKEQIAAFAIAKEPSVKTQTAFWHEDTGLSEIFTDYRVVDLANKSELVGIDFKNVYLKKGEISQYIYQITSENKIKQEWIDFGHGEEKLNCQFCGKEQFLISSAYQLHLNTFLLNKESDLYVTDRIFGEGRPYPLYLISQRFYRLLRDNKLTGNLSLFPVVEVST